MFKTTKKDLIFFDLFSVVMDDTCKAAEILQNLFTNYNDIDEKIGAIEKLEHSCDRTIHDIIEHLNRSFITPIDREDIFLIAKTLDDIIDNIEATAQALKLFMITRIRPQTVEMARLVTQCTRVLAEVVGELKVMKTSKTLQPKIIEVNNIENQGDETYNRIIQELFAKEQNPVEIIKWKEIIESMESTLDTCESIANMIEGIVSKNV
ncbi:putative phosphate transport regulator [[Clostridium] cellulosi]|uniref:Putative phosphate transport regulator n=1 Tax=[Clostridium] cellulosi TaxID=29343 RepID=A0A078KR51_9FIRM|nr:putative phosphate transport regulator [[Clostridium] cellulosi]